MNIDYIKRELISLGMKPNLKGFEYTANAIEFYERGIRTTGDNGIYGLIGKKFNDSESRVDRAIRHSIQKLYEGREDEVNKALNTAPFEKTPTNTEFICLLKIILEQRLAEPDTEDKKAV